MGEQQAGHMNQRVSPLTSRVLIPRHEQVDILLGGNHVFAALCSYSAGHAVCVEPRVEGCARGRAGASPKLTLSFSGVQEVENFGIEERVVRQAIEDDVANTTYAVPARPRMEVGFRGKDYRTQNNSTTTTTATATTTKHNAAK